MAFYPSSDFADEEGNNVKSSWFPSFSCLEVGFSFFTVRFELGLVLVYYFDSEDRFLFPRLDTVEVLGPQRANCVSSFLGSTRARTSVPNTDFDILPTCPVASM